MSTDTKKADSSYELEDNLMDTSIDDARWLLGSVATLGFIVIGLGLFASTLAV